MAAAREDEPAGSFLWRGFADARLAGYPVSCQVVATTDRLGTDWHELVGSAHAIVFVVDSHADNVEHTRESFDSLREALRGLGRETPILLQANKQDVPGALPPQALGQLLSFDGEELRVFQAQANMGKGVASVFLAALRTVVRGVRELPGDEQEPEGSEVGDDRVEVDLALGQDVVEAPGRVPGGCIWPPRSGRRALDDIGSDAVPEAATRSWAPSGSWELVAGSWVLHSRPDWVFEKLNEARSALAVGVRSCLEVAAWLPEGRGIFVSGDGDSWRMWASTKDALGLRRRLQRAIQGRDCQQLEAAVLDWLRIESALRSRPPAPTLQLLLDSVDFVSGSAVCLALPSLQEESPPAPNLSLELERLLSNESSRSGELISRALRGVGAQLEDDAQRDLLKRVW